MKAPIAKKENCDVEQAASVLDLAARHFVIPNLSPRRKTQTLQVAPSYQSNTRHELTYLRSHDIHSAIC